MKTKRLNVLTIAMLFLLPTLNFAQAPTLGTAANFVLFSSVGAVTNTGITQLTGNVGTNVGSSTGFGNVNGVMDNNNGATLQCASDLLIAYDTLNADIPTSFPASPIGNGDTLIAGIYQVAGATVLNTNLYLNAKGNPNAVFILQIQGPLSTNPGSRIILINGALACNVFWKVEGLVSMGTGTIMKGNVIANNAAINMSAGDTLEGRALSTGGAVSVDGVMAYTPIGCGSPVLTGPAAPELGSTACYALFSTNGQVTNSEVTHVTGDVGTNAGLTSGFDALDVTGEIHPGPDVSTSQCAADLGNVYTYLNGLPYDIELLYPAQFGNNLVLTPHTYIMKAATALTDSLYLNADGDSNAVFVIQIFGALSTSTFSKVILVNGTQPKNVYWEVNGAVSISNYSDFSGTIICNNGAILLNKGVILNGRALTTTGALTTDSVHAIMPPGCLKTVYPNVSVTTNVSCNGGSNGSLASSPTGGTSPYTYSWQGGTTASSISNLSAGTYTLLVTDSIGTTTTVSVSITQPIAVLSLTTNSLPSECPSSGIATGVSSGGTSPYTYSWNNGRMYATATGLSVGTYTVTVWDANSCSATASVNITQGPLMSLSATALRGVTCSNTGSAIAKITNGVSAFQFSWSPGGSTRQQPLNLIAATYTVTVTDHLGCTATASVVVTQSPALSVTAVLERGAECSGNGEAFAHVTNGVSAFQFSWSPGGSTSQEPRDLTPRTYTVTVTDHLGCKATATVSVSQVPALSANISNSSCSHNLTTASIKATGGTAPYIYSWSPGGGTKATMSGLSNGSYTITVTDKWGCSVTLNKSFTCNNADAPGRNNGNDNNNPDCCPGLDNVNLYPNPSNGQFTLSGLENGMLIEVYDYTGRRISNITAGDNTMQFNLSNQPNGIYLVRVLNTDGTLASEKKVVKTN